MQQGFQKAGQTTKNNGSWFPQTQTHQNSPSNLQNPVQYHTQHSAALETQGTYFVSGDSTQPVMSHHNSWPSAYLPANSGPAHVPNFNYSPLSPNDLGIHQMQIPLPVSEHHQQPGSNRDHQHHHRQQHGSQIHVQHHGNLNPLTSPRGPMDPVASHHPTMEPHLTSPYLDPSASPYDPAHHASYLAQIAQANQLELFLAAEAQRQHQAAVAAMQAQQHCQFVVNPGTSAAPPAVNQHLNLAISPVTTSIGGIPTMGATSLEDIYCSSTSEASGPTTNIVDAVTGRLQNASGSALSLNLNNNNNNNNDSDCFSNASTNTTTGAGSASTPGGRPVAVKKYEVIKPLGVGTYGKVKLTKDVNTKQLFAVKTINLNKLLSCDSDDLASIKREIEIMSSLHHPNIIHIREVLENRQAIIIVMECALGGELFQHLHRVKLLSESEARRLFRQTVSAIYYCHSKLIAHRDLKLENILLDEHINVKIADFGLSSPFTFDGYLTTFCGSPLYAAPEIVTGTPYHGPEIDCWSLGVILYILVYGKMPFEAPDGTNYLAELCRKIIKADYPEPPEPSTARDLIGMMLRPNPSQRGTIQDIAHHWWMNVNYTLPVTHLPENSPSNLLITSTSYATNNNNNNINTSSRSSSSGSANHVQPSDAGKTPIVNAQSMFTRPRGDAAERRGSYKRRASQKSTSISSYTQIFPNLVNIYKADTIDFSEQVSILGNARPHPESGLRVMEPDSDFLNKQGIVKRRTHHHHHHLNHHINTASGTTGGNNAYSNSISAVGGGSSSGGVGGGSNKHKYEGNDSGCVLEEEEEQDQTKSPRGATASHMGTTNGGSTTNSLSRSAHLQIGHPVEGSVASRGEGLLRTSNLLGGGTSMGSATSSITGVSAPGMTASQRRHSRGNRNVIMTLSGDTPEGSQTLHGSLSTSGESQSGVTGSSRKSSNTTTMSSGRSERRGSLSSVIAALDSKLQGNVGSSAPTATSSHHSSQRSVSSSRRSSFSRQKTVPGFQGQGSSNSSISSALPFSTESASATISTVRRRSSLYSLEQIQASKVNSPSIRSQRNPSRDSTSKLSNLNLTQTGLSTSRRSSIVNNRQEILNPKSSTSFSDDESDYYSSSDVPKTSRERKYSVGDYHERRPLSRRTSFRRAAMQPDESATDEGSQDDLRRGSGSQISTGIHSYGTSQNYGLDTTRNSKLNSTSSSFLTSASGYPGTTTSSTLRRSVNYNQSGKDRETAITSDDESTEELHHVIQHALKLSSGPGSDSRDFSTWRR